MKKSIRHLFLTTLLLAGGLITNSALAKQPRNLNEAIITRLNTDSLPASEKAIVFVSFSVDDNGKVAVLELNGSDQSYLEYVRTNLQDMNLSQFAIETGKTFYYRISFTKA